MSTTSKHPRDEDASAAEASAKVAKGDSGNDSPTPSSSLATFWDLPFELRSVIFELAYKEQEKGIHGTRLPRLERKTLLSLTLVSRQLHSTFSQLLYAHVQLTKPSVLADFHRALVLRPSNALLVKSLHMGQLTGLAQGWWPVRWMRDPVSQHESYYTDEPLAYFKTSWSKDDEAVRPRWCKPGQDWVNDREDVYNPLGYPCHEKAVMDAISAALKGVGVSLYADHFDEYETTDGNREFLEIVSSESTKSALRAPHHASAPSSLRTSGS